MKKTTFFLTLTIIIFFSCNTNKEDGFELNVKINGNYTGYLYLNYNEIKDSCLVKDGKVKFTGSVSSPTMANYSTNNISASDKNFYLENEKINTEITYSKKQIREYNIDWFTIDKISGTKTSLIEKDFEDFKKQSSSNKNWQNELYEKLNKLISQNPNHRYSGDLLSEISNDTILNIEQLKKLYSSLNIKHQDSNIVKSLKYKIFPEQRLKIGDKIIDFELPDNKNKLIKTEKYRNKILFIDFWASWCVPCRKQFPKLKKISTEYKDLNILGVSFDKNEKLWLKALEKENTNWENVIDTSSLLGIIAEKYGINYIPYNVLVNEKAEVIAIDLEMDKLKVVLDSIYKQ